MSHSITPWTVDEYGHFIRDAKGRYVCQLFDCTKETKDFVGHKVNSKRIVDCVNACSEMSDPQQAINSLVENTLQKSRKITEMEEKMNSIMELLRMMNSAWEIGATIGDRSVLAITAREFLK